MRDCLFTQEVNPQYINLEFLQKNDYKQNPKSCIRGSDAKLGPTAFPLRILLLLIIA